MGIFSLNYLHGGQAMLPMMTKNYKQQLLYQMKQLANHCSTYATLFENKTYTRGGKFCGSENDYK